MLHIYILYKHKLNFVYLVLLDEANKNIKLNLINTFLEILKSFYETKKNYFYCLSLFFT